MSPKSSLAETSNWQPPPSWTRITTIEMHTGGEPLRVFTAGLPPIDGRTVLEKRRYFSDNYDHLRKATMWEPRGHADMYGAVLSPSLEADFDAFFLHNEGYSTMCGHAIIALTTLAIEAGLIRCSPDQHEARITFSVPAGLVHARATVENGRARDVTFQNVPSFLYLKDREIEVAGIGRVRFDLAYGGAFYAVVDAASLGFGLTPEHLNGLIDCGRRIKRAVTNGYTIEHPAGKDLGFLYGTIFTGPPHVGIHHSRNVCIFADGEVDRSATGSGVSARAALHFAKGQLRLKDKITIESILGSTMTVQAIERTTVGSHDAVIPEVGGTASFTGRNELWLDPDDPLGPGFIFR